MRVKTYRGSSTNEVLTRIKAELGADAVILSTRNYKENGESAVEVTAALEDAGERRSKTKATHQSPQARELRPHDDGSPPDLPLTVSSESMGQWHKEWSCIKEHLTTLLRPQMDFSLLAPIQRQALEYLEREGVDIDVIMELFRRLKGNPKTSVLAPLEVITPVRPWGMEDWPQLFHALAGPAGVGKTQALVRMALECKEEDDRMRVCMVNADARRMKSKVVLQHYAELANLDYREVSEPEEAASIVAEARNWDVVLIDLPALDRGRSLPEHLQDLGLDAMEDLCVHLALSPQYAPAQLRGLLDTYARGRVASLIWTKLDESYTFGAMVNTGWSTGLPCSAFSYGSGLSGTMCPARHLNLWRMLFKHRLPGDEE